MAGKIQPIIGQVLKEAATIFRPSHCSALLKELGIRIWTVPCCTQIDLAKNFLEEKGSILVNLATIKLVARSYT